MTKILTTKCWNNQAFITFVACFGKIPLLFIIFFLSDIRPSNSSPGDVGVEGKLPSDMSDDKVFGVAFNCMFIVVCCGDAGCPDMTFTCDKKTAC